MMEDETLATLGEYDPSMEFEHEHYNVQNEDETVSPIESVNEETISRTEESTGTEIIYDNVDPGISISSIMASPQTRSGNSISFDSNSNIYELRINNQVYKVLFPKAAALEIIDNQLVNVSGSNITGAILNNDSIPNNTYIQQTYTLLPATNSNSNNNRYQYGAIGYITTYSVGSYGSLTSSQQYGNNTVEAAPSFGVNISIDTLIVAGLLLALCLIQIIGGIFRR